MKRYEWRRRTSAMDPVAQRTEIFRIIAAHEFPWDVNQALSFALFRTYAVPSIGALLHRTGEFTERVQKRYDDTVLLMDAMFEHGLDSPEGRTAVSRVNRMHAAHDISQDDLRYVLATFVVMPIRWIDAYGWRPLSEVEKQAVTNFYNDLGRRMGIGGIPPTWQAHSDLLDAYEATHFAYDDGARAVADSTLGLLATFPPFHLLPAALVRAIGYGLMDAHLREALGYPRVPGWWERGVRRALRLRGQLIRWLPPRESPLYNRQFPSVRGYPNGYDLARLGTFPHPPAPG